MAKKNTADHKVVTVKKLADHDLEKHGKLAKQAKGILDSLDDLGGSANMQELINKMQEYIETIQTQTRIFQKYKNKLVGLNLIEVTKQDSSKDLEVESIHRDSSMSFRHLKTFVVAADSQNFTQAADRLNMTPSAVSLQMKTLEDTLATDLFDRTVRPAQLLTPQGRAILPNVL